jgi:hypothetical protein
MKSRQDVIQECLDECFLWRAVAVSATVPNLDQPHATGVGTFVVELAMTLPVFNLDALGACLRKKVHGGNRSSK